MLGQTWAAGTSFLHAMDARAKLLALCAFSLLSVMPLALRESALECCAALAVAALALGLRELFRSLRPLLTLVLLLVLFTGLFYRDGSALLRAGGLVLLTTGGLEQTYRLLCRLVGITVAFWAFFRTTSFDTLNAALRWFRIPFVVCLMLSLAVRLVPTTAGMYRAVEEAHSLRVPAAERRRAGPLARAGRMVPVLTAVVIQSVRAIPVLSMALESRGVGRTGNRTVVVELPGLGRLAAHTAAAAVLLLAPLALALLGMPG